MSTQQLSDGQWVETTNVSKVELFVQNQNLLVTLKTGHLVGVHGPGALQDVDMFDKMRKTEYLTYSVYRHSKSYKS